MMHGDSGSGFGKGRDLWTRTVRNAPERIVSVTRNENYLPYPSPAYQKTVVAPSVSRLNPYDGKVSGYAHTSR